MGCTSPLVDSGGVMVCESRSYLIDGCSPDIDTSTSDWASQLVTVRRNEGTAGITFPHVLLTFGFDTAVSLTGIEMDLFNCPDWNIGIPSITVYLNPDYNLAATTNIFSLPFVFAGDNSLQSSCDSLSTVTFSGGSFLSGSYRTVYILVDLSHTSSIQHPSVDPTPDTPPSRQSSSDNTLTIALVSTIVGLILLVFILAGSIIFVLMRRRSRCNRTHYMVKTVSYELEKRSDPRTNTDNYLQATNPMESAFDDRYVCPSGSLGTNHSDDHYDFIKKEYISDALYDVVANDEPPPPTESAQPFPEDEFDGGHYEVIHPPISSTGAAASSSPAKKQQSNANSSDSPKSPEEAARMYSLVKVRKAPKVPEKSSDLKDYLAVRIFNENIYSEHINPSDFISQQPEPEEEISSDPIIYAPIYPSFTELPESFELPPEVDSSNVKEKSSLRTGHYGDVVLASTVGLSLKDLHLSKTETNKNVSVTVAMKKLKLDATPVQRRAFETEAKFLSRLRHPNVVRLLGACYEDPTFIMMEYMKDGDLSQFLQKYSEVVSIATPSSTTQITQSTLVFMASQICSGMKQLAALNFIHRDLATRNCLVGNNFSVKVASLGVDKNIYQSHYFRVQGNTLLPIRWMATECFDGKFSEKSDVWAFGVTMWEMFTLAKQLPYRHLSDEEVIHNALKREYRQFPTQSSSCPQSVYEIMERCWVMDFNERITFGELQTLLHTVLLWGGVPRPFCTFWKRRFCFLTTVWNDGNTFLLSDISTSISDR
ncbi:Class II receptor tyrosine kinase [Geodia barretti]|uniref:Class II receptor tyrosine kinase n=1 Tax=Geodia barretti TaxID=519541 RepID=A0AA35RJ87_GEOBA|nr:Class II receptor tyrosine kinase [Geodia barretti]